MAKRKRTRSDPASQPPVRVESIPGWTVVHVSPTDLAKLASLPPPPQPQIIDIPIQDPESERIAAAVRRAARDATAQKQEDAAERHALYLEEARTIWADHPKWSAGNVAAEVLTHFRRRPPADVTEPLLSKARVSRIIAPLNPKRSLKLT